jgi:hypothetical protein
MLSVVAVQLDYLSEVDIGAKVLFQCVKRQCPGFLIAGHAVAGLVSLLPLEWVALSNTGAER